MNALQQLMAAAGNAEEYKGFAGYCTGCGRGMYRRGNPHQEGWVRRGAHDMCETCYQNDRNRKLGMPTKAQTRGGKTVCDGCGSKMRGKRDPKVPGVRLRQTKDLCTTCYHHATKDDRLARCKFTHCTVCGREFGSVGTFGGTITPASIRKGNCTRCRDRICQEKKRSGGPADRRTSSYTLRDLT